MKYTYWTRETFKRAAKKGVTFMVPYYYRKKYGKQLPKKVKSKNPIIKISNNAIKSLGG